MKKNERQKRIKIEYESKRNIACPLYMELKNLAKTKTEDIWFKLKGGDEAWYEKIKRDGKSWYRLNENQLIRDVTKNIGKHRIKDPMLVIDVTNKNKICYKVQCNECGNIMEGRIHK